MPPYSLAVPKCTVHHLCLGQLPFVSIQITQLIQHLFHSLNIDLAVYNQTLIFCSILEELLLLEPPLIYMYTRNL